jgi:sugar lactone lactonase YvrE
MSILGSDRPRPRAARAAAATALGLGLALVVPALAPASSPAAPAAPAAERAAVPRTIELPDGFQPEGIAKGRRGTGYVGSLADGRIYAFDLRTGERTSVVPGPGTPSVGLDYDRRTDLLFVSGGDAGNARVVDPERKRVVAEYTLSDDGGFVNDVIVTDDAAWFTNSAAPELFRVPLNKQGLPAAARKVTTVPLTGDWVQPDGFGANGITRTPDGSALLVVNSADGTLFRVPTDGERAGVARQVRLRGQSLTNGDGMLQQGRTLYVVRNQLNEVVQLRLDARGTRGRAVGTLTARGFDVPTTITAARGRLYLPNARFGTEPTPDTTYTVSVLRQP